MAVDRSPRWGCEMSGQFLVGNPCHPLRHPLESVSSCPHRAPRTANEHRATTSVAPLLSLAEHDTREGMAMKISRTATALGAAVLLALTACGGGGSTTTETPEASPTASEAAPADLPRRAAISRRTPGPPATRNYRPSRSRSTKASTARVPRTWLNNWPLSSTARRSNRKCRTGVDFEFRRGPGRCHGDHRGCREADRLHDQCDRQSLTRQDRGLPGPVRAAGATRASATRRSPVTHAVAGRSPAAPSGERWPAVFQGCARCAHPRG